MSNLVFKEFMFKGLYSKLKLLLFNRAGKLISGRLQILLSGGSRAGISDFHLLGSMKNTGYLTSHYATSTSGSLLYKLLKIFFSVIHKGWIGLSIHFS